MKIVKEITVNMPGRFCILTDCLSVQRLNLVNDCLVIGIMSLYLASSTEVIKLDREFS